MLLRVAIVLLVAVALIILAHVVFSTVRRRETELEPPAPPRFALLRFAIYLVWMFAVLALAVTAYVPMFTVGHLDGWMLWGHLLAAGAFIVLLLVITLLWSGAEAWTDAPGARRGRWGGGLLGRLAFWAMIVASLVSLGTMMAAMTELADTDTLRTLIAVHRYAGLGVLAAAAVHLYTVVAGRFGLQ